MEFLGVDEDLEETLYTLVTFDLFSSVTVMKRRQNRGV